MKQKTARNLKLGLCISVGIIVYSFYTMTLLWGIFASLLIITFILLWSKNPPNLNEKNAIILKIGIVIVISYIIYSFYMQALVWGFINAVFVVIITVFLITLTRKMSIVRTFTYVFSVFNVVLSLSTILSYFQPVWEIVGFIRIDFYVGLVLYCMFWFVLAIPAILGSLYLYKSEGRKYIKYIVVNVLAVLILFFVMIAYDFKLPD